MKYYAHLLDDKRTGTVIRVDNDVHCQRYDWKSKEWVHDPAIFLEIHGVGGDGYDWKEVTEGQAEELIKNRQVEELKDSIEPINIDADPYNANWTKKTWDLPPYKSAEFLALVNDLDAFRRLPVYQMAVKNGLIKKDEWVGSKKTEIPDYPTHDKSLIGAAGVHFVVSELSLRGLIALPTVRNTAGVDIVAVNKGGTWQANLQVKTSRSCVSFWPVGTRYADWCSPNNYYVFVRYSTKIRRLEAFLESSLAVAQNVAEMLEADKAKGTKAWAPYYYPINVERVQAQWDKFGIESMNQEN